MYLVYGLQKSGISITKLLQKKNQVFQIWDDNISIRKKISNNFNKKFFFDPNFNDLKKFEKIYVSPGISIRKKIFSLKNIVSKIQRDSNLYFSSLLNQKVIAVTGTNGKSTTTKLIGEILKKSNYKTFVGGNIGEPLCNSLISKKNYTYHVIELSSFQLETIKNIKTKISIITNLSSDHLDRYKNITDYINQKKNIITNNGINLVSLDDQYSKKIFSNNKLKNKISFSISNKSANIYMNNNYILDNYFKKNRKLYIRKLSRDLEGKFNNQNIIIAYICCKLLKLSEKNFLKVIENFKGLPFRSKIIYQNKKLKITNNSKSTNINSTINSIKNYNNLYLIMGGIAKEKNFEIITKYHKRIICVYTFGESAKIIEKKLKKKINVKSFKNLNLVIQKLKIDIKKNKSFSNILFAPGCSSFDQYLSFEERGKDFNKLIKKYLINL